MKRKRAISSLCLKVQKREGIDIINFVCFVVFLPSWLEFDVAPEISGSPWCPSFKEDNWVLFKWERERSRHQSAWKTRSGLPGDSLGWVGH